MNRQVERTTFRAFNVASFLSHSGDGYTAIATRGNLDEKPADRREPIHSVARPTREAALSALTEHLKTQ